MASQDSRLILVTGGTGYVGSVLVPALAKHYRVRTYDSQLFGNSIAGTPNVEAVQGDIRDMVQLELALEGVTDVIHLAGIVTDELVDINPEKAKAINCDALQGLLELCGQHGVERFILMSSSSVYGGIRNAMETDAPQPMTEYARQKLAQEMIVKESSHSFHKNIIRSATLCGPAPRMRLDTIVNTFCKQAWFDNRITVWGGRQQRTNVHVAGLVTFYLWLLRQNAQRVSGETFNITSGNHTALALANRVRQIMASKWCGRKTSIEVDTTKSDLRSYSMLASKARRWGWRPHTTIDNAIMENFAWFAAGGVDNPNDDIYYNNRRLGPAMMGASR